MKLRNEKTGTPEEVTMHRIGTTRTGKTLYHAIPGYARPAGWKTNADGNWVKP